MPDNPTPEELAKLHAAYRIHSDAESHNICLLVKSLIAERAKVKRLRAFAEDLVDVPGTDPVIEAFARKALEESE